MAFLSLARGELVYHASMPVLRASLSNQTCGLKLATIFIHTSYDESGYGVSGVYGLLTKTTSWHDIANNLSVNAKVKYDAYGNVVESTDANGNVSTTAYSSTYAYAYPTSVTTPVPDAYGTYGSNTAFTTSVTYDYNTGLTLTATDANGAVTEKEYDDPLLRSTKVITASGTALEAETARPGSVFEERVLPDGMGFSNMTFKELLNTITKNKRGGWTVQIKAQKDKPGKEFVEILI